MTHTTVTARIPKRLNEALKVATEDEILFRSEVIRRALKHYLDENPDNLGASKQDPTKRLNEFGRNQSQPDERDHGVNSLLEDL